MYGKKKSSYLESTLEDLVLLLGDLDLDRDLDLLLPLLLLPLLFRSSSPSPSSSDDLCSLCPCSSYGCFPPRMKRPGGG